MLSGRTAWVDLVGPYIGLSYKEHREQLDTIVAGLLDMHGLQLRFEEVVHHDDNDALRQRLASSA
ncbi:hypothetical protein GCM10023080_080410 [Streptomyces pseudoechinosporeus]